MPSMAELTMFHSQLSSIMEKLAVSAVTEINRLMADYFAVLRLELSREKHDNGILRNKLRAVQQTNAHQGVNLHHPVNDLLDETLNDAENGNSGAGLQLYSGQRESIAGWKNGAETAEEDEEETLRLADCKTESVTIKHERLQEEAAAEGEAELTAPARSPTSPPVSQQQEAAEQSSGSQTEWQFCSQPAEGSEELHTDYRHSVETQHQFSISPGRGQLTDVCLHIKREAESPDLDPPVVDVDGGFEFHQGLLSQTFPDSGALPPDSALPDTAVLTCYNFSLPSKNHQHTSTALDIPDFSLFGQHIADGDTSGHHGNHIGSGGSCGSGPLFMATRASECIKYVCEDCGKGFPFPSMMKRHRLSHTGERTQHCGQCGMSFIRRSHLRRHELLHSGLRPFACQVCGRQFSRSSHLNTHMKTHRR
ncbi:uncharacterized protein [Centroberyx affinis]|uniref:uncharacterized protein n=1 Tax=Centroberyx affinis TaxID=166261 RepID=UPI003A5BC1E2